MTSAFRDVFSGALHPPRFQVFSPILNYSTLDDRLIDLPRICDESRLHQLLLDSYHADGGLGNADTFRPVCYQICDEDPCGSDLMPVLHGDYFEHPGCKLLGAKNNITLPVPDAMPDCLNQGQ